MKNPKKSDATTRDAILNRLKLMGSQSAADLSTHLNLTPMAVRLQLYGLMDEGLVESTSAPSGRGRPTLHWSLTDNAAKAFPDAHQSLAVDLIDYVEEEFGEKGLVAVIDRHSKEQLHNYLEELESITTLEARLRRLAGIRTREGYMATVIKDGRDWLLAENHCPVCAAATRCTRLCTNELSVFQSVLGDQVNVSRDEHIIAGSRRCLYRIQSRDN